MTIHIGTIPTGGKAGAAVHVRRDGSGVVWVLISTNDGVGKNTETVELSSKQFSEFMALLTKAQQRATELLRFGG